MKSRKGFTLIELLVVISIIAIISAILFPVFARAKVAAKATVALSNIRQVNMALLMYASDNEDKVPPYCSSSLFSTSPINFLDGPNLWTVSTFPYTKGAGKPHGPYGIYFVEDMPSIFFDPQDSIVAQEGSGECQFGVASSWGISDFVVNKLGTVSEPGTNQVKSMTELPKPAEMVLLAQTKNYLCPQITLPGNPLAVPPYQGSSMNPLITLEARIPGQRVLVCLADGHVGKIALSALNNSMKLWDGN